MVGLGAHVAGPAISLSFLSCGSACILTSLAYAEFAARIPVAGSAYTYVYGTLSCHGCVCLWFWSGSSQYRWFPMISLQLPLVKFLRGV